MPHDPFRTVARFRFGAQLQEDQDDLDSSVCGLGSPARSSEAGWASYGPRASERTRDPATGYHLQDVVARIDEIMAGDKKP